jgi:hypothetical protein
MTWFLCQQNLPSLSEEEGTVLQKWECVLRDFNVQLPQYFLDQFSVLASVLPRSRRRQGDNQLSVTMQDVIFAYKVVTQGAELQCKTLDQDVKEMLVALSTSADLARFLMDERVAGQNFRNLTDAVEDHSESISEETLTRLVGVQHFFAPLLQFVKNKVNDDTIDLVSEQDRFAAQQKVRHTFGHHQLMMCMTNLRKRIGCSQRFGSQ